MRLFDRNSLFAAMAVLVGALFSSAPARACLNTGTVEPCHCIQDMMVALVTPAASLTTPTITGAAAGVAQPAVTQSFFVGDNGSTHSFYSVNPNGNPNGINTTIHVGDTLTWTISNTATTYHSVTTVDTTPAAEAFDFESLNLPGDSASHTFMTPGTYYYYCTNHDGYNGYDANGVPQFFGTQHASVTVLPAPEPGSIAVLTVAGFAALLKRRPTKKHG